MKKKIVLICLLVLCGGCGYYVFPGLQLEKNRNNLLKLKVGMTTEQAKVIMGKPDRTEAQKNVELWFYWTSFQRSPYCETALVFENNELVKWGQGIVEDEDVDKYEIRMR